VPIKQTNELYLNLFFSIPNTLQFNISATEGGFKEHPAVNDKDIISCEHTFRFLNVFKKAPDALLHPVGFDQIFQQNLLFYNNLNFFKIAFFIKFVVKIFNPCNYIRVIYPNGYSVAFFW